VDNCAVFCGAATLFCDAFGCTRTDTELTCHRWFTKKRLREGASNLSFAAAAELPAITTSSPSLKLTTRT